MAKLGNFTGILYYLIRKTHFLYSLGTKIVTKIISSNISKSYKLKKINVSEEPEGNQCLQLQDLKKINLKDKLTKPWYNCSSQGQPLQHSAIKVHLI